jgi:hypothetical protein
MATFSMFMKREEQTSFRDPLLLLLSEGNIWWTMNTRIEMNKLLKDPSRPNLLSEAEESHEYSQDNRYCAKV